MLILYARLVQKLNAYTKMHFELPEYKIENIIIKGICKKCLNKKDENA